MLNKLKEIAGFLFKRLESDRLDFDLAARSRISNWKKSIVSGLDSRGFTFIETLAALFVIMIGISSFVTLINQTVSYTKSSSYNLIAAYLGKEGVEIVKNIRDSNFLKDYYDLPPSATWYDNLTSCGGLGCQGDYNSQILAPYNGDTLKLPQTGGKFYNYGIGIDTMFKRRIRITSVGVNPEPDYLFVEVEVMWDEKGRSHNYVVQDTLYPIW
ncbi:MAG TPA: hypothetical protein P5080_02680 [Candidatus Paceibacterota bacterium]|nr:hypothetical protein [Candidatus Pacearchaeota archaeon]HRZ50874.1 hypothetical protein [Candidatus Paceibacterota bacterium]HSA36595.1 hypothetical protein [Candidatus Paceibacterota bacterium]